MVKSWKTTAAGLLVSISTITAAVAAMLDSDPGTVPDWDLVAVAVVGAVGLIMARDNDKSSEDVGAKK